MGELRECSAVRLLLMSLLVRSHAAGSSAMSGAGEECADSCRNKGHNKSVRIKAWDAQPPAVLQSGRQRLCHSFQRSPQQELIRILWRLA